MIDIGKRRELFIDDYLVDTEKTEARRVICPPVKREIAFVHDAPWEATGVVYHNIVRRPDGKYFMYYKSNYNGLKPDGAFATIRRVCVIESDDGIHWTRPQLVVTPLDIAETNNVISHLYYYFDNLFIFYDTNPDCPEDERYKAVYGEWGTGLFIYRSADGIHFNYTPDEVQPVYPGPFGKFPPIGDPTRSKTVAMTTEESECYFDTLNIMYWDKEIGKYVALVRGFHVGDDNFPRDPDVPEAVRDIRRSESEDLVHWTKPVRVTFNDDDDYQLYAIAALRYYRAPQIMVATPTRYIARAEWNDSFDRLCGAEERRHRGRGQSITDAILMASRDSGKTWYRTGEAFFTPGPEHGGNWVYGDCYPCVGMIETPSMMEGADPVLSMYVKEDAVDRPTTLYRYEMRVDGFACRRATYKPQKLVTKPFVYDGDELEINFSTSAAGWIKFTLRCDDGREIHTSQVFGDKIDRIVGFDDGSPADFRGKPVTLIAEMCDASLYAVKFN